jgi:hypothetical protein
MYTLFTYLPNPQYNDVITSNSYTLLTMILLNNQNIMMDLYTCVILYIVHVGILKYTLH